MRQVPWRSIALALRLTLGRQNALIWIGAVLLVAAASMQWGVKPWLKAQNQELELSIQAGVAEQSALQTTERSVPVAASAAAHAEAFYEVLGEERLFEEHLGAFLNYAKRAGLTLAEADYDRAEDAKGKFVQQGLSIPLSGAYGDLRDFCETTLLRMPFVALDSIQLRRKSVEADALEARLHWTLYLRHVALPASSAPPLQPVPMPSQQISEAFAPARTASMAQGRH